ncbi:MAG: metallophosphoesterase family protein [Alphaproteobacteria bacterium]
MFSRFFAGRGAAPAAPEGPPDTRIYAIGDIHGRLDLLKNLHGMIERDAAELEGKRKLLIYLGDYVDRGSSSRQVVDYLLGDPLPQFDIILLRGNHEEMMLSFLDDPEIAPMWMINGGEATLASYGIGEIQGETIERRNRNIQTALKERLPRSHVEFLYRLGLHHVAGDYLFVHAGVAPGVALKEQVVEDLLWIREAFINSDADHGKCVVHGHTVVAEPEIRDNRIAIDTGAYYSNILSCLVVDGGERRFLQT